MDSISRQAAIDGADAIIARDTSGNNDVVKAMTAWKEYIKGLPSAQPEQRKNGGDIWDRLSEVYNMDSVPDEAKSIIGDAMIEVTEKPEQDCILKQFGKCSYDETGCSDCKIKAKIRTTLTEQPESEDITFWKKRAREYEEMVLKLTDEMARGIKIDSVLITEEGIVFKKEKPEQRCVNCGRTANNGGWYKDGRTRCPIEEHYALPKDGYCHLWEKRNVTDDDYPERRTDG